MEVWQVRRQGENIMNENIYNVIYADPPWSYRVGKSKKCPLWGLASNHYRTMTNQEIYCYLGEQRIEIADNAALFLWCTNPHLETGLQTILHWGFSYKTNIAWIKTDNCPGVGFYVRGCHELLLFGTRGKMRPEESISPPITSVIHSPRTGHSRKPLAAYELIERMYPAANMLELFAREIRPGWSQIGNELGQHQIDMIAVTG